MFDLKNDISSLVCLLFGEMEVLTDGHTFQSDEKPPPGSQLLVTQQVSHICCFVLFASLKTGAHVVDFTEISYHCTPTKEVCVAYE